MSRPIHKRKQIELLTSLKTVHPATTGQDETDMSLTCRYSFKKENKFHLIFTEPVCQK